MSQVQPRLPFRNDTFLGVCEGLGEDFGFHANWLRIAFALAFYFNPTAIVGTYFGLGLLVLISRTVYPRRPADKVAEVRDAAPAPALQPMAEELSLAA